MPSWSKEPDCVPVVFLPLWSSHPEIPLHSGTKVSLSQISEFCRTRHSGIKRKMTVARAQSLGKKRTLLFFFPFSLGVETSYCLYNQNAQGGSFLDFTMKCFDPRKFFFCYLWLMGLRGTRGSCRRKKTDSRDIFK